MMELLHAPLSRHAQARPEALAVACEGEGLSYGELEAASNRIARALRSAGVARGDRVCLVLPKSPRTIAAILGVLKTGAIYVPIDPDSPAIRSRDMITACDTRWILGTPAKSAILRSMFQHAEFGRRHVVGWMDEGETGHLPAAFQWPDVSGLDAHDVSVDASPDLPAYILFTSGSTGIPKGVVIRHANVLSFLTWALPYFGLGDHDRISGHPPLHFDLSVFDVFGALLAGAELHLVPPEYNLVPAKIARLMAETPLTQWFSVPSVLSLIAKFDLLADQPLPELRRVLWCGEVLPTSTLRYWMTRQPAVRFTNLYGPTEATIASSYYAVPRCPDTDTEPIPIGTACDGEELLVLDDQLRPVPPEMTGDLFIAGAGLSEGYWRDAVRTAEAFLPDPRRPGGRIYRTGDLARVGADGLVTFVGRTDTQIKSRGYRIELGEIEAALTAESVVKEGAVVAIPSGSFDGMAICCAYVPLHVGALNPRELRTSLATRLPSYMLPTRWKELHALPRNANGKLDRRQIERAFASSSSEAA